MRRGASCPWLQHRRDRPRHRAFIQTDDDLFPSDHEGRVVPGAVSDNPYHPGERQRFDQVYRDPAAERFVQAIEQPEQPVGFVATGVARPRTIARLATPGVRSPGPGERATHQGGGKNFDD